MKHNFMVPLAALTVAAGIGFALPAQSAPLSPMTAATINNAQAGTVEAVQYRRGWRRPGWGYRPYYRRGPAPGAVIGGLAAGALIGGAIASSQARADAVGYCSQRYRSYDPASGTYLGNDGYRHPCP